ncbi:MAG TPA: hypothetical protein VN255_05555, partial [Mycobacterium sp.]|nr:hypothetical protein [Mycobacterium sp.]
MIVARQRVRIKVGEHHRRHEQKQRRAAPARRDTLVTPGDAGAPTPHVAGVRGSSHAIALSS